MKKASAHSKSQRICKKGYEDNKKKNCAAVSTARAVMKVLKGFMPNDVEINAESVSA